MTAEEEMIENLKRFNKPLTDLIESSHFDIGPKVFEEYELKLLNKAKMWEAPMSEISEKLQSTIVGLEFDQMAAKITQPFSIDRAIHG